MRLGNPALQEWGKSRPPHLCSLAATNENTPPKPANTTWEDAQLSRIPRDGMVLGNSEDGEQPEPKAVAQGSIWQSFR